MSRRRTRLASLSGGRRRRRPIQLIATSILLLAPLAVAVAAYLAFASDDAGGGAPALPIAVHTPPAGHGSSRPAGYHGKPLPAVKLGQVDAFHLDLRKPPRAGLVFDVD